MKTCRFEVLNPEEIQQIHAASKEVLVTIGVNLDCSVARQIFARAGASLNETNQSVRIPEALVMQGIKKAPKSFRLCGADGKFSIEVGSSEPVFAEIGTPTIPRQKASIREWALRGRSARGMIGQLAR